jgi:hypothetical protein
MATMSSRGLFRAPRLRQRRACPATPWGVLKTTESGCPFSPLKNRLITVDIFTNPFSLVLFNIYLNLGVSGKRINYIV